MENSGAGESKPGKGGRRANLKVDRYAYRQIANEGGRLRWKIENEGFNMRKNGGYNLEHTYSHDEVASKNFNLFLQIAHIISQLMEKGSLLKDQVKKVSGSIRNASRKLLEELQAELAVPFRIRFNDSP